MNSDKFESEQSEMILRPQFNVVIQHAAVILGVVLAALFFSHVMYRTGLFSKLNWTLYLMFLFLSASATVILVYLLYVMFSKRAQLKFVSGGIVDQLSPFSFGPIARQDIKKIQVTTHFILGTTLIIDLNSSGPALKRMGPVMNICFHTYALFFDGTIYFPLIWLGVTKHDLESRLMLYRQKVVTDPSANPDLIAQDEEIVLNARMKDESRAHDVASKEQPPTPIPTKDNENAELLKKVEQIKQHVVETHLDLILCELYTDEISQWLEWDGHPDWPKPKELCNILLIDDSINYQEITFIYNTKQYHFGLRRNVGSSQEALLSVSYEGTLCVALRVQVEIGALTPKKLEQYMRGEWEQELRGLYDRIADLRGRRRAGDLDDEGPVTQTDVEIDNPIELKRRFGI